MLIITLFTPGASSVDTHYKQYSTFEACYAAKAVEEKKLNEAGKSYIAMCDIKLQ